MGKRREEGYIAGKLFKEGDIWKRQHEEAVLSDVAPTVKWFNPINNPEANDKSNQPTAKTIFDVDTQKVIASDYIVAELDDEDSGTMFELGVCYGINFLIKRLRKEIGKSICDLKEGSSDMERLEGVIDLTHKILSDIPEKKIFAHATDIRLASEGYKGRYMPFGYNQYVVGGIESMGEIFNSFEDLTEAVRKTVEESDDFVEELK